MAELRYLFDTNIISALIKDPQCSLATKITSLTDDTFCTSIVVASELRFGARNKNSPKLTQQVEAVLSGFNVLPLDEPVDHHYAEIRHELQRLGQPIGQNDLFIAAHARALNLVLVTANVREFRRVPHLLVENWL